MPCIFTNRWPALLLALTACGGQTSSDPTSEGSAAAASSEAAASATPVASADCAEACRTRVLACGAPEAMVPSVCLAACGATASQQACVRSESCEALASAFEETGTFCGIGCPALCAAKAATCDAPADVTASACARLCDDAPTPAQMSCVLGTSCETLEVTYKEDGEVCGLSAAGRQ